MSPTDNKVDPVESGHPQGFTAAELDDLIWDIAVGRPTRVVLDTTSKRDTALLVRKKINEAVGKGHIIELLE